MKKLFTFALSAVALMALSACGGASYSKEVLEDKDGYSYHAVGGWGEWAGADGNKMAATSVAEVAKLDKAVANKLAKKNLKHLYTFEVTLTDASWGEANDPYALVNGEKKQFPGGHTVKVLRCKYNAEKEAYGDDFWYPNPGDNQNNHVEALTSNLFISPFQKLPDENGFSWADNPVVTSETGTYTLVFAEYNAVASETVANAGFAVIAK